MIVAKFKPGQKCRVVSDYEEGFPRVAEIIAVGEVDETCPDIEYLTAIFGEEGPMEWIFVEGELMDLKQWERREELMLKYNDDICGATWRKLEKEGVFAQVHHDAMQNLTLEQVEEIVYGPKR